MNEDSKDELEKVLKEVQADTVVSLVGGNALTTQKVMMDAAFAAGVVRFLPSEFGANTEDDRVRDLIPLYNRRKECIDHLETLSKKNGEFSWTGIIAGAFFDWGLEDGFLGFDLEKNEATIVDSGTVPFCLTNLSLVAHCIVNILTQPAAFEASRNKFVHIASHVATQHDILDALQTASGKEWKIVQKDSKQAAAEYTALWDSKEGGDMAAVVPMVQIAGWGDLSVYGGVLSAPNDDDTSRSQSLGDFTELPSGLWNEKLALPMPGAVDLQADVRNVLDRS